MHDDGYRILRGTARDELQVLRPGTARCCITSPPYWNLRDYGVEESWNDGWTGQLGLEPEPAQYISHLVECFEAVRRVLTDDGTLWIVIGDTYARKGGGGGGKAGVNNTLQSNSPVHAPSHETRPQGSQRVPSGYKAGDLIGIPWMLAFALRNAGWYLRQEIVWNKPNAMPESVRSRCTRAHEQIFTLAKSKTYYYDHEAVKEPSVSGHSSGNGYRRDNRLSYRNPDGTGRGNEKQWEVQEKRNRRSVWSVRTQPFPGAHFAVFPKDIVDPCLLAGSAVSDVVLDPFCGTGTVGMAAAQHGRRFVGVELNDEYADMAEERCSAAYAMIRSGA